MRRSVDRSEGKERVKATRYQGILWFCLRHGFARDQSYASTLESLSY